MAGGPARSEALASGTSRPAGGRYRREQRLPSRPTRRTASRRRNGALPLAVRDRPGPL